MHCATHSMQRLPEGSTGRFCMPRGKESFKKSDYMGNLTKAFFKRESKTKNQ